MWIVWCLFARRVRRGGEVDGALKPRPTLVFRRSRVYRDGVARI